jgi:hypothetical protein
MTPLPPTSAKPHDRGGTPMFAVIFEVQPKKERWNDYLDLAKYLKPKLEAIDVSDWQIPTARRESNELNQKRFGLISELVPNATTIALLETVGPALEGVVQEMQEAARKRGVKLQTVHVRADACGWLPAYGFILGRADEVIE